jgi:HEPN domain-containing protein
MSDPKAARELIVRALMDLEALRELIGNRRIADEIFGFLAQHANLLKKFIKRLVSFRFHFDKIICKSAQAAEKSLKAWPALLGKQYPITHNLDQLLQEFKKTGVKIAACERVGSLNPFVVQFRYESLDLNEPDLDRREVLRMGNVLVEKVHALVDAKEDHPDVEETPAVYKARPEGNRRAGKPERKNKKKKSG